MEILKLTALKIDNGGSCWLLVHTVVRSLAYWPQFQSHMAMMSAKLSVWIPAGVRKYM